MQGINRSVKDFDCSLFITFIPMKNKQKVALVFIFLSFCAINVFGQDTLRYCQSHSPWVSNCYHFYKLDKQSTVGIFEKFMYSDDGQRWYGKGKFTEYKNKIVLDSFKIVRTIYHIRGDSLLKDFLTGDTTNMHPLTFQKKGNNLYQKRANKIRKTVFMRI